MPELRRGGGWLGAALRTLALGISYGVILALSIVALVAFLVVRWSPA